MDHCSGHIRFWGHQSGLPDQGDANSRIVQREDPCKPAKRYAALSLAETFELRL